MTKVLIEPVAPQSISKLISFATQLMLDPESADILEFCQAMSSECWSGYVDGKLICCWGLIPPSLLSNQAYLWMHSTDAVKDHQFLLVRHSQRIIEQALRVYDRIIGHCNASAADSIRWLRWLGAEFEPPSGPYRGFVIKRKPND